MVRTYTTPSTPKASPSSCEGSRSGADTSRTTMPPIRRLATPVRNTASHVSLRRSSTSATGVTPCGALLDGTGDVEDGQVHGDQEAADHAAQEHHHDGLDHRREAR